MPITVADYFIESNPYLCRPCPLSSPSKDRAGTQLIIIFIIITTIIITTVIITIIIIIIITCYLTVLRACVGSRRLLHARCMYQGELLV